MKGYIAIVTVLVLLVVTVGIASTMTFSSVDASQTETVLVNGQQALYVSESCMEEVLLHMVRSSDYSGGEFSIPEGQCRVTIESDSGGYIVRAGGTSGVFEKDIAARVVVDSGLIHISDWREE